MQKILLGAIAALMLLVVAPSYADDRDFGLINATGYPIKFVGVNAPGTANSTTFLPLNNSSVVFGFGPSAVITVKAPLGTRSPTLIAMTRILSQGCGLVLSAQTSA